MKLFFKLLFHYCWRTHRGKDPGLGRHPSLGHLRQAEPTGGAGESRSRSSHPDRPQISTTRQHQLQEPRDCLLFLEEPDRSLATFKNNLKFLLTSTIKPKLNIKGPQKHQESLIRGLSVPFSHHEQFGTFTPSPLPTAPPHEATHQFQSANTRMLSDSQNTPDHVNHWGRWAEDYCALEKILL